MLDSRILAKHLKNIECDGYTIVENAIDKDFADELRNDLIRLENDLEVSPANNEFEGTKTKRIYNLLIHGPLYQKIPIIKTVLPIVDGVLDNGCLISSLSSINILPGESAQPIHADDQLIPLAKPHMAVVCNSMWALTDFTEENGATRIVPGSHLFDHSPDFGKDYDSQAAEMSKGSVLVYHGSLWHGGGANRSQESRVGVAMNYCAGFIRQQENQQLGLPLDLVRQFPNRLRTLVGYGVYRGLIGHINKTSPENLLDDSKDKIF